jgi:succinate dehydrogenase/fumarate reductase flavoprotein subunit
MKSLVPSIQNRLGGNYLLEIITFGKLTGKNASLNTHHITLYDIKKYTNRLVHEEENIKNIYKLPNTINFQKIKTELGKELFTIVGLFREESHLQYLLEKINHWIEETKDMGITDKSLIYNTDLKEFCEFKSILNLSVIIVKSALYRKESRGAHYRIDYLETKKEFEFSSLATKRDEDIITPLNNLPVIKDLIVDKLNQESSLKNAKAYLQSNSYQVVSSEDQKKSI